MHGAGLDTLAKLDDRGRRFFRLVGNDAGEYVLAHPDEPTPSGYRELAGADRQRLAVRRRAGPGLVVENAKGDYVVLVDALPDPGRHVPVDLDDAAVLVDHPVAVFGRRGGDQIDLTPWQADEPLTLFDPDDPAFADVPVIRVVGGALTTVRGHLPDLVRARVHRQLYDLDGVAGVRYGVLANEFGEALCVAEGEPVETHADVRFHTVIRGRGIMDGAATLEDAAADLRAFADRLDAAAAAGWRLPAPIADDLGFPERPRP